MAYKYGFCDGFSDDLCGVSDKGTITPIGNMLGCSSHVAYVQDKCQGPRLCELLDISELNYDRRLDDVSEAFVEIPLSGDEHDSCCSCLADVEPWCHILTIVRESDGVVWSGPITKVVYRYNSVRIEARDKLAWLQKRVNEVDLFYPPGSTVPYTDVAQDIIETAMAEDDSPCVLDCIINNGDGLPAGADRGIDFPAFGGPTAFDDLQTLADFAVDYTVMNQCIILGPEQLPAIAIGILTDEHILGELEITKDGIQQANTIFVRYEGDADCDPGGTCDLQGALTCPCPGIAEGAQECYGLTEQVFDDFGLNNVDSANQVASSILNNTRIAPRILEFPPGTRLSPETPWSLNEMIPGQRMDVALSKLCLPIFQSFKIQKVEVRDGAAGEEISIDLKALNPL